MPPGTKSKRFIIQKSFPSRFATSIGFEPWMKNALKSALVLRLGAFFDVGANIGQTLLSVLTIDMDRQYIGIEPQLDCCSFIDEFIKKNALDTHTLLPIGLSDREEVIKLFKRVAAVDSTASAISGFRLEEFYSTHQYIYVSPGDQILPRLDLKEISTIKIDVEGGELEVISGLRKTLSAYKPIIIFEV